MAPQRSWRLEGDLQRQPQLKASSLRKSYVPVAVSNAMRNKLRRCFRLKHAAALFFSLSVTDPLFSTLSTVSLLQQYIWLVAICLSPCISYK